MRTTIVAFLVLSCAMMLPGPALASPFRIREYKPPPLMGELKRAEMVFVGQFIKGRSRKDKDNFEVIEVLKPHAILKGKDAITLPLDWISPNQFLVFANLFQGNIDAYRALELDSKGEILTYFKGAMKLCRHTVGGSVSTAEVTI